MWRKVERKEEWTLASEMASENTPAPLMESPDGFIEQMERVSDNMCRMKEGIWSLVEEMWRLIGVVERWVEKDEKLTGKVILLQMSERCSALKQNNKIRAECDWGVTAMNDNC